MKKLIHPYQMVSVSPWPLCSSLSVTSLLISLVLFFNQYEVASTLNILSLILLILSFFFWINDIVWEGTFKGEHSKIVVKNLQFGFLLFLLSEILIFFILFFAFFYNAIIPNVFIGSMYPPLGLDTIPYEAIPLFNTALLFFGSICITAVHHAVVGGNSKSAILYILITILLNSLFTFFQAYEYYFSSFNISDSFYGSSFFTTTGVHGLHVVIGTLMAVYCLYRLISSHFINTHHVGLWASSLYLHLVDLIWIIVLVIYYVWGM